MPVLRLLMVLFILLPLIEIYLLIQVGSALGAIPTILLLVLAGIAGALMVRFQGLATLFRVRASMARGELPGMALLEGLVLLVAGVLLLTPGFFTDIIALFTLIPSLRRAAIRWFIGQWMLGHRVWPRSDERRGRTLEGEYRRKDD